MTMIRKAFLASLLIVILSIASAAHAQFSSNLQGVTSDNTGAVIPGATVVLTNTDNGVSRTTVSGPQGEYRFVSIAPGPYEITASAKGFATHKVAVTLSTNQTMNVPFTLGIRQTAGRN